MSDAARPHATVVNRSVETGPAPYDHGDEPDERPDSLAAALGGVEVPVLASDPRERNVGGRPADTRSSDEPHGWVHIDCPGCGLPYDGPPPMKSSALSFCPGCDYPLFLATPPAPTPAPATDAGRRRLPGIEGVDRLGRLDCPECGEPNPPEPEEHCVRCGALLTPRPPLVIEPLTLPPEGRVVVVREEDVRWKVVSAVLFVLFIAAVFALIAATSGA